MRAAPDHLHAQPHDTNRLLGVLFAVAISLPLVVSLVSVAVGAAEPPRSGAAPWPARVTSVKSLGKWPERFRRWFKDNYAFRRPLIRAHGRLLLQGFGVSPSPTVLIGRDGWWYYADDGAVEDMVSASLLGERDLEIWRQALDHNRAWLAGRSIPYLFVLAPDKHLVYPEFLPETVHPLGGPRLDQLADYLRAHSSIDVLNLRPPLVDAKRAERVYHRTDTHWNKRGALLAYLEMARWIARVRPGTVVPSRDDFEFYTAVGGGHDLPRMLGLESLVSEEILEVRRRAEPRARVVEPAGGGTDLERGRVVTELPDPSLPRILFFRDSFLSPLIPFLAEQCSRCVFLWERDLDPAEVERERPDIVIHEMVGRRLHTYLPYDAIK
jgi:hypothetical protein